MLNITITRAKVTETVSTSPTRIIWMHDLRKYLAIEIGPAAYTAAKELKVNNVERFFTKCMPSAFEIEGDVKLHIGWYSTKLSVS